MLDAKELERYARHIVLREVGGPGQAELKAARVLVVGAGGLGAPVLLYLAAAGVGTLGVVDDDDVSLSNLQRQVIHATADIGKPKVERAGDAVKGLNPHVNVETHHVRLTAANALDLIARYDIVADGSDNFATRYLVSDACLLASKPLVTAAVGTFDGSLTSIRAHETRADGTRNPTYRCLFPEPPPAGTVPACAEAGILGALTGVLGSLMALEVIREIVGFGEGLVGRLLMVDARSMRFETLNYAWDPDNPLTGNKPTIRNLSGAMSIEGIGALSLPSHSIDGSTRSGGLWPSMKVLMLMMTFSPMSMRPSIVAEPICGSSTTLPARASLTSCGLTAGSCSNTSRPAPAISPASIMRDQRILVDDLAARGVDDIGFRPHQLEPARREQMIGRRRVRAIDRDDVHARQHLVEAFPIGRVELFLDLRRRPGGGCDSGSAGRRRGRGAPPPARCGPCR